MEHLKSPHELCVPDPRQSIFVRMDTGLPVTLQDRHAAIASLELNTNVPEDIRNAYVFAQNMWLYGWFYYPLHSFAEFHVLITLEMALWDRHNRDRALKAKPRSLDSPGLSRLMNEAIEKRWIVDSKIDHAQTLVDEKEFLLEALPDEFNDLLAPLPDSNPSDQDYCRILAETLPKARNYAAHPEHLSYRTPGLLDFSLVRDLINQLYASTSSEGGI